jgi:predicted DNA-binding protein
MTLDGDIDRRLGELAARTGKSKAELAAEILRLKVDEYASVLAASERASNSENRRIP